MLGSLLKVVGVGAFIGGAALAAYTIGKKCKEAQSANTCCPIQKKAEEAVEQAKEVVSEAKKAVFERPAKLTASDWYDKGLELLGEDTDKDHLLKAKECFQNASDLGDCEATRMLAEMYSQGYGVEQDRVKAFELYREAAEEGDEESWTQLGTCYAEGVGTDINPVDAFYWFAMAAAAGDETAKEILGDLATDITDHLDYPLEVVQDWYAARYQDLTEDEQEEVEEFWENCEDEVVQLDTDYFADESETYIITDNGDMESVEEECCCQDDEESCSCGCGDTEESCSCGCGDTEESCSCGCDDTEESCSCGCGDTEESCSCGCDDTEESCSCGCGDIEESCSCGCGDTEKTPTEKTNEA